MYTDTKIIEHNIVNIAEYYEVEYWTARFGVSVERLKTAVKAVGTSAEDVAAYLNNKL
jgi:hypothetical protein